MPGPHLAVFHPAVFNPAVFHPAVFHPAVFSPVASFRASALLTGLLTGLLTVSIACECRLAPGQTARGGTPVMPRLTREELLKKWDLNGDGTLDAGEVEVATSKMRLERAEMRLSTGLDPVTGKPRDAAPADADDENAADTGERKPLTVDELAAKLGFAPVDADGEQSGTPRSPDSAANNAARPDTSAAIAPRPMFGLPPLRSQQPGALLTPPGSPAPGSMSPGLPLTGGVRAGGLPARPGYGSHVAPPSLNAGRADATTSGGLVPRRRLSGDAPELPAGLQPPAGTPSPATPRPRRTVDDFDVYR
jgi:hypothetical protein